MSIVLEVNCIDRAFFGAPSCVAGKTPRKVKLVYGQQDWNGISVFVDSCMSEARQWQSRYKAGWLLEGGGLHPGDYENSRTWLADLDFVMTYDAELLKEPGYVKYVKGGIWIPREDWGLHPKSKFCSFLYSRKDDMPGHHLRHQVAKMLQERGGLGVDVFCDIGYSVEAKKRALKDYAYAIVVEGDRQVNLFSEHLLDPIMLGCVPLYWGCPNVAEYLDGSGLVCWRTLVDLADGLASLSMSLYPHFLPYIKANQAQAERYEVTEDEIADEILFPFLREKGETI
jgi:hypothetical protein